MQNEPRKADRPQQDEKPRRSRVRLPFEPKRRDAGTWSYDHRAGICITVILYMLVAIGFLWGKIELGGKRGEGTILIEFPEEEKQIELTEEQIRALEAALLQEYMNVRNLASNENSELNSALRDDRGTDASQLYDEAGALDDKMQANRDAYEEGLRRIEAMRNNSGSGGEAKENRDAKVSGMVTVSYSFTDPVRESRHLVVPAYRCEGGGQVVVNATVDNGGNVIAATVDRSASSADNCMQTTAVSAALQSKFNLDTSAPSRHRGTITYIFIPQ